jgi:hypothetical protein
VLFRSNSLDYFVNKKEDIENIPHSSLIQQYLLTKLTDLGYKVDIDVGQNNFKLDLAIVHSNGKKYALGIIIDGAHYAKLPLARTRHLIIHDILKKSGWTLFYVYSCEFLANIPTIIANIEESYKKALAKPQIDDLELTQTSLGKEIVNVVNPDDTVTDLVETFSEYEEFKMPVFKESNINNIAYINNLVAQIIALEAPVSIYTIKIRIKEYFGLSKVNDEILVKMNFLFKNYNCSSGFVLDINKRLTFRKGPRRLKDVYLLEVCQGMKMLVERNIGLTRHALFSAICRFLNCNLTESNRQILETALTKLFQVDSLCEVDNIIKFNR